LLFFNALPLLAFLPEKAKKGKTEADMIVPSKIHNIHPAGENPP